MKTTKEPSSPLISIIVRTKNEERWIDHCLSAIATQSNKDYEFESIYLAKSRLMTRVLER